MENDIICLKSDALRALIDKVVSYVKEKHIIKEYNWISAEEAKERLKISSNTTLQKLRDQGKIRYSQPEKKHIVYDVNSINEYFEKHAKNTF